jgi:hypothetical protein
MTMRWGIGDGNIHSYGNRRNQPLWRSSVLLRPESGGKLAFLNNVVEIFRPAEVNFSEKI